jgi:hypothetical protein
MCLCTSWHDEPVSLVILFAHQCALELLVQHAEECPTMHFAVSIAKQTPLDSSLMYALELGCEAAWAAGAMVGTLWPLS